MIDILEKYKNKIKTKSDINEHLITINRYCSYCDNVTEMGVRDVVSTWAMLASKPKKMISYDIIKSNNVNEVEFLARKYDIDYIFHEVDVLKVEIDETDLLFIDTLHTYEQLHSELLLHSNKVKKYIILHDTATFGFIDEKIYNHASDIIKNKPKSKQGLILAINNFLSKNENWFIKETFINNNGLTVLENNGK